MNVNINECAVPVLEPSEKLSSKLQDTTIMLNDINTKVCQLSMYLRGCNTDEAKTPDPCCVSESIDTNRAYARKILDDITEICERI